MAWYFILLIIVGSILGIILLALILKKLCKPKFNYKFKHKEIKAEEKTNSQPAIINSKIGLNLEENIAVDKFVDDEEPKEENKLTIDKDALDAFKSRKFQQKTIAQQIRELPPALKVLLFDRGLARKDVEFKSKKD